MMIIALIALYLLSGTYFAIWTDYQDSRPGGDFYLGPANDAEWAIYVVLWPVVGFSLAVICWAYEKHMR